MLLSVLLPIGLCIQEACAYPSHQQSLPLSINSRFSHPSSDRDDASLIAQSQKTSNQYPFISPSSPQTSPPSPQQPIPPKGVTASQSHGVITMHAPYLHQSTKLEFSYKLFSPNRAPSIFPGRMFREIPPTSNIIADTNGPLIQELALYLLDAHPQGVQFPTTNTNKVVTLWNKVSHHCDGNENDVQTSTQRSATTMKKGKRVNASVTISLAVNDADEDVHEEDEDDEIFIPDIKDADYLLSRDEWRLLVGLLRSTAVTLKDDILGLEKGFCELRLNGKIGDVLFNSVWTFWQGRTYW